MTHEEIFAYPAFRPSKPLTEPFGFAVIGAAHGHIYEMCNKLIREGAELKYLYDRDPLVLADLAKRYPQAQVCEENEILDKQDIRLIASAAVPARRADIGIRAMRAGKDYFVDKAPMTTLEQVAEVRRVCAETGRKCFVFYGESVSNESTVFALNLVRRGIIGDVFHVTGSAPHRLNLPSRPEWFFHRENTGGILIDLVCHQIHQYLEFADEDFARVDLGRVANHRHPQFPGFDDFGDADCTTPKGITGHFHVDWFTPDGLSTWGDSRMVIQGTKGTIELRKNCDIARDCRGSNVYVITEEGEFYENVTGKVPMHYFSNLISDCLNRTDTAMNPERAFAAIEIAIRAQMNALSRKG